MRLPGGVAGGLLVLVGAWLSGACGSSDPAEPGAGGSSGAGGGVAGGGTAGSGNASGDGVGGSSTPAGPLHGSVVVELKPASADGEGYTTLIGRFFDGPTPNALPLELDSEEGECQLRVPVFPFCAEPCAPDACTADDECTPYPTPLGVGTVTIEGLGMKVLELQPASAQQVYQAPSLPNPACEEGEPIVLTVSGMMRKAECITQLELTGPDPIPVQTGKSVALSWAASAHPEDSRIRIGLDIAHHGGRKGEIDCEVPDIGSFEIPEALVTKLVGLGLAGFPTISLTRVSVGLDPRRPDVELVVSSNVVRSVDTGVVSCQDKAQCAADQECLDTHVCG